MDELIMLGEKKWRLTHSTMWAVCSEFQSVGQWGSNNAQMWSHRWLTSHTGCKETGVHMGAMDVDWINYPAEAELIDVL